MMDRELKPIMERVMRLKSKVLEEAYEWALENILPEMWYNGRWMKCAKGSSNVLFSEHSDMSYGMHYLTGMSTALKVLDYAISSERFHLPEDNDELLSDLKKSLFCYLFHDYNKVSDDTYRMRDCEANIKKLVRGTSFEELMKKLGLDVEDVCSAAYMTEVGTSQNIFSQRRVGKKSMSFQYNFNTLADGLSSRYLDSSDAGDIKFGGKFLISRREISKVRFQSTHLFALTGLLRDSVRKYLTVSNKFFLWDVPGSMLFVGEPLTSTDYGELARILKEKLGQEMTLERTMEMTDRTVGMEAASIIPPNRDDLDNFIRYKFSEIMHLPAGEIRDSERETYESYSREVYAMELDGFNIDCFGKKRYRDCLLSEDPEETTNDMRVAFVIRFLQLNITDIQKASKSDASFNPLERAMNRISKLTNKYDETYRKILGKEPRKSAILIPLIVHEFREDLEELYALVLKYMGKDVEENSDFSEVVRTILTGNMLELEDVPDKTKMSIISGGTGSYIAKKSNLYGVNTQTFSNRLVPSTSLANGRIDRLSAIENLLRKSIMKYRDSSAIMFARIPGPVPIISTRDLIKSYMQKENHTKRSNPSHPDELFVGRMEITPQVDNSFMLSVGDMRTDADAIRILKLVLEFSSITQMKVLVTYANSPVFGNQKETLRFEIHNSLLSSMGYDRLRCDQIGNAMMEIEIFERVAASFYSKFSDSNTAAVIREFARSPLSIFKFKKDRSRDGKGDDFILKKFEDIRKMVEKRGKNMKNLEVLAQRAAEIARVSSRDSNNSKTWLIRTGLEGFEKARSSLRKGREYSLEDMEEFCAGPIWSGIERDANLAKYKNITKVQSFAKALVTMLNDDFGGKVPSGNARSYLISAFEYMYIIKSEEMKKNGE